MVRGVGMHRRVSTDVLNGTKKNVVVGDMEGVGEGRGGRYG